MSALERVLVLLLVVLVAVGVALLAMAARRRVLQHEGGFDLCLRLRPGRWGGGWVFGVGRYDGDRIAWYRTFGVTLDLSMEPQAVTGFLAWLEAAPPGQHRLA
jgi:Protein of unknown function (DUF2550)